VAVAPVVMTSSTSSTRPSTGATLDAAASALLAAGAAGVRCAAVARSW
jgi:hypothetical protein